MIRIEGIIFANEPQYLNPDYDIELKIGIKLQHEYKKLNFKVNTQAHSVVHLRKKVFDRIRSIGLRGYHDFTIVADKINLELKYDSYSLS